MINRIEEVKGIGLLHDANGRPHGLQKATLIYADNGRGKSTLTSILRSVQSGDASVINERKTIDGTLAPQVTLQFGSGHKVTFSSGSWSQARPELLVFDSDFVEKNVHSGGTVTPGQRKNLLEFALGAAAVAARVAEENATADAASAKEGVQQEEKGLLGYHQGMTLVDFEGLVRVDSVEAKLTEFERRIVAARNRDSLSKRPLPQPVSVPDLEIPGIFTLLGMALNDIEADAERKVRAQVAKLGGKEAETWLSQGQQFDDGAVCPYCTQSTTDIDLIKAYRSYFNEEYIALKREVADLEEKLRKTLNDSTWSELEKRFKGQVDVGLTWADQLDLIRPQFDFNELYKTWTALGALLLELLEAKKANPIAAIGSDADRAKALELWAALQGFFTSINSGLEGLRKLIDEFLKQLAGEDIQTLERQQRLLLLNKARFKDEVIALFAKLNESRTKLAQADQAKQKARDELIRLMEETLKAYQTSINDLLTKFGANFQIEKMDANFRGSAPRAEYGLAIRGQSVKLDGGTPSFATALSEGDKRTLAFAFFVASALADPQLSSRVIVVDDPMSSLDANRKHHTKTVLQELCTKAEQLLVLAHDVYFVRDLRDELGSKAGHATVVLGLAHAMNGYTDFVVFDVDYECRSRYYYHHSLLAEYVNKGVGNTREVAKAIRLLLEGYLHRRFPGLIANGLMFGGVVQQISNATAPSPLCYAQGLVPELNQINSYAGQFHHDTNPGNSETVPIVPTELMTYSKRALQVVYKGAP
jgi:wobble nucleotide-excising tRNase